MKNFTYYRPTTPSRRLALLDANVGQHRAAGRRHRPARPAKGVRRPADPVVSLTGIKGVAGIEEQNAGGQRSFRIGAGTKLADIAAHAGLRQSCSRR